MTQKIPQISIIIPTYNRSHLLCRAIQSILDQTYQDFDLIVVDDGSTDDTENVVKSFNHERISYIRHEENEGVSTARNTGIRAAKGEYIAFQDSDDEWLPEKLEKQIKAFETAAPGVGVIYTCCLRLINNRKSYLPSSKRAQKEGNMFSTLLRGNLIALPTVMVRRECFEKVGMFDERFRAMGDWELLLRISRYYQFKHIDEPLVISYHQPDSISVNLSVRIKAFKLILGKYFEDIRQDKRALTRHFSRIGDHLCANGELSQGRDYLIRSLKEYPLNINALGAFLVSLLGQRAYNIVVKNYQRILLWLSKGQ